MKETCEKHVEMIIVRLTNKDTYVLYTWGVFIFCGVTLKKYFSFVYLMCLHSPGSRQNHLFDFEQRPGNKKMDSWHGAGLTGNSPILPLQRKALDDLTKG